LRITDASRSVLPDKHLRVNATKSLQIPVTLTPSILVNHISERYAADWPKPAHGRSAAEHTNGSRAAIRAWPSAAFANCKKRIDAPRPSARVASSMFCTAGLLLFPRTPRSRWRERYPGSIPNPQRAENMPPRCACRPQQFAGNCILCERRLIGEARRALCGDHTGSGTASYSFVSEESGNLDIAIVVRHDLSLLAG